MATKPAVLPRPWCTNAVYATGPFAGSPGKVDPGAGVAAEGHRPGANDPTAAEHENWQQNLVTASWIPWVNSGSSAGAADAHIVETDSTGRAILDGLNVINGSTATVLNVTGNTVASPVFFLRNTDIGPIMEVLMASGAGGAAISVNMTGATSGQAFSCTATSTSSGQCYLATVPAGSTSVSMDIVHSATASRALRIVSTGAVGVQAASIATSGGVALRLTDTGANGCPLVLTPRTSGPTEAGSLYVRDTDKALHHIDNSLVERINWNSQGGMFAASQSHTWTATLTTGITVAATIQSVNYSFINGQKYWVEVSFMVGKTTPATTTAATVTMTIGGAAVQWSPFSVQLFQGAASQLETYFHRRFQYTATSTGSQAVVVQVAQSNGSSTINVSHRTINIEGHYD